MASSTNPTTAVTVSLGLCSVCSATMSAIVGDALIRSAFAKGDVVATTDTIGASSASSVCSACCGVLQTMKSQLAPRMVDCVSNAPFVDCDRLATTPSMPRVLSYTFPATLLHCVLGSPEVPQVPDSPFNRPEYMDHAVPSTSLSYVRDAAAVAFNSAFFKAFFSVSRGSSGAVRHRCHPTVSAMVDDNDTIIAEAAMDLQMLDWAANAKNNNNHDSEAASAVAAPVSYGVAFLSKRATVEQAGEYATSSRSRLALAISKLPLEQQSNKGDVNVTWGFIQRVILAAMVSDLAEGRCLAPYFEPFVWRTPVYLFGHYRKMMRDVSQSPWFLPSTGVRIGRSSLQEAIAAPALKHFYDASTIIAHDPAYQQQQQQQGDDAAAARVDEAYFDSTAPPAAKRAPRPEAIGYSVPGVGAPTNAKARFADRTASKIYGGGLYKFHSAGREDVDVRMLGSGRPFVLELLNPHRSRLTPEELIEIENAVNRDSEEAEVEGLAVVVDRQVMALMHQLSEEKRKMYRCVCYSSRRIASDQDAHFVALNATRELQMVQRTPMRVVHRRSLLPRVKTVHSVKATRINDHWFLVDLETQAGAYIKEFCHGDLGRTTPSLGEILDSVVDIIQLDVVGVECSGEAADKLARMTAVRS